MTDKIQGMLANSYTIILAISLERVNIRTKNPQDKRI